MERRGRPRSTAESLEPMLLVAIELIAQCGSASVTMRDIAEAADVSVGRLQHHFESRNKLIRKAQEWYLQAMVDEIAAISVGSEGPWERVVDMCLHASLGGDRRKRVLVWIDLLAQSPRDAEVRLLVSEINASWCAVMEGIIAEGVARGVFWPSLGVRGTAETLVLLVDGIDVAALTGLGPVDAPDRRLVAAAEVLLGVAGALPANN
jgi:AcrR family transcriptional regulator